MHLFLKILVAVLIFFTPFSFAATEPWAFCIVQGLLLLAWIVLLIWRREFFYSHLFKPVAYVFLVLIGLGLLQSCFAHTLLQSSVWYPVTLIRLYTFDHLSLFVTYFGVVCLAFQVYASFDEVKQLLGCLVVCGLAVALCALIFPHGTYIIKLTGIRQATEAVGPFLNRNHGGLFLAMNALLALGLFFTYQLQGLKALGSQAKRTFVVKQCWLGAVVLGLILAAVFSRSRGAMLSLFIGLFSYALLCMWCVPQQIRKRLKRIFYTLLLLGASCAWIYAHIPQINEFSHRTSGVSADIRQMMYRGAVDILKQYPIWGIGEGALPVVIPSYTEVRLSHYIEHLHNDWLEMTVEIGLIGAGLVLIGFIWFAVLALKKLKRLPPHKQFLFAALLSALLAMSIGCLVDFHFFIPGCSLVFLWALGGCLSPTFHKGHVHAIHMGWVIKIIILACFFAACVIPFQKARAWRAVWFGKGLKTEGKLKAYQQGLAYYPSPRNAVRLGNAYYNASKYEDEWIMQVYYLELAQQIAQEYLEKYPKDKELSQLYLRTRRQLD
ncbi:MAG: O-antigen ligase family protein [Elusimicrobiaceae bacterium]|nr:O-antigen ligase family protein [Elusimicrobiaceae bacterium]